MLRSAALILSGSMTSALMNLLRNLLVARLISLPDYGIATTFALAMAVVEMMSALGLPQQLVQDRRGNDPEFQAQLQGIQVLRGLGNAAVLMLIAAPIAQFLGTPQVTWAYRLLALVPLLRGFEHFDPVRFNRRMHYLPAILSESLPILLSLLAVWPLYLLCGDYRVLLFAFLIQSAATLLGTHLAAERPYRLRFDRAAMRASFAFGWPLMLEGAVLFAIFNGERLIVGHTLGMTTLALFSMGFTLTLTPTLVLTNSAAKFFLPQLSAARDGPEFERLAATTFQLHFLFGGLTVLAVVLLGTPFVHLALGTKFAALPPLLIWLAILQGLRVLKGGSSTVALARALTGNALISNLARVAFLPLAWIAAQRTGAVLPIIALGILGEFCGFVLALILAQRRLKLPLRPHLLPILLTLGEIATAAQIPGRGPEAALVLQGMVALLFALSLATMAELRRYLAQRSLIRHAE